MRSEPQWQRTPNVAHEILSDVVVTFALVTGEVRRLDGPSSAVYVALANPAGVEDIMAALRNDVGIPTVSHEDVLPLLHALESWALVEQVS